MENNKTFRNPPLTIKIVDFKRYNDKYTLIQYTVYGHELIFSGLIKHEKLENVPIGENPDTVYAIYSNGAYINFLGVSTRY